MKRVLIVGAGGHGRAVAEMLSSSHEYEIAGFVDDAATDAIWDRPILGPTTVPLDGYLAHAGAAIVAIGNNRVREGLQARLRAAGFEMITAVHPRAFVAPSAIVGEGSAIMAGAVVGTEARVGAGVIVNVGAAVDHHCQVHDFAHLGTGSSMAGGSILGPRAWLQAGAALGYGVCIAADEVLMPGAGKWSS